MSGAPPDEAARRRIRHDLDTNFLVEAGAGSGKTTSLVSRMVALVRSGACTVDQIAAVTFTRMAAAELRQRFQEELERAARELGGAAEAGSAPPDGAAPDGSGGTISAAAAEPAPDAIVRDRLRKAIRDIEKAFLGTIHAFCARLLRERPLEAGLEPGFTELQEVDASRARMQFWPDFLEGLAAQGDKRLHKLERLGVAPAQLLSAFHEMVDNPDVDFVGEEVEPPGEEEVAEARDALDRLLDDAEAMIWGRIPRKGDDSAGRRIKTLLYRRKASDWQDRTVFLNAIARLRAYKCKPTQRRWADDAAGKQRAKALGVAFTKFGDPKGPPMQLVNRWWAHRYPEALSVARDAADAFAAQRRTRGEVTFQDLLVLAAELLRSNPEARRELGRRYQRILVDEFQDTDPLQAEIVMLLASDPDDPRAPSPDDSGDTGNSASPGNPRAPSPGRPAREPSAPADWQTARPRAGALFVVGDPKQSIYRFRRADISLYDAVKRRFEDFGEVLRLESNFRSLPEFSALVEGVFRHETRFPEHDSELQAAYAPLNVRTEGSGLLATYLVHGTRRDAVIRDDAAKIASEIARRVGDRQPGDFLVLTYNRRDLAVYARALENRNLPVAVSGADAGFEDELAAFLLLLKCLADPEHQVRLLGVLTGPLFGITLDRIERHDRAMRRAGRRYWLAVNRPPTAPGEDRGDEDYSREVSGALTLLHGWWDRARVEPADITAERLVDEIDLFPMAAADTLGEVRAGALTFALDAIRAQTLAGDASLAGAITAVEAAIDSDDAETPLIPGRPNCVRVMNLHRAKGLEADVVFLAAPIAPGKWPPRRHISRGDGGPARGSLSIGVKHGFRPYEVIAQPLSWDADRKREEEFGACERVRLVYVAATRAKHELWIARRSKVTKQEPPLWKDLGDWVVQRHGPSVDLQIDPVPVPDRLPADADLAPQVKRARAAVAAGSTPTYQLESVGSRAKRETGSGEPRDDQHDESDADAIPAGASPDARHAPRGSGARADAFDPAAAPPGSGGMEWGSVVHETLAAAGDGMAGEALARLGRDLLVDHGRPLDATGAPTELDALLALVDAVRDSEVWRRAMASPERHMEIPFAVNLASPSAPPDVLEGVIDLVFKEGGRWVVADYKTDRGDDPDFATRGGPVPRPGEPLRRLLGATDRRAGRRARARLHRAGADRVLVEHPGRDAWPRRYSDDARDFEMNRARGPLPDRPATESAAASRPAPARARPAPSTAPGSDSGRRPTRSRPAPSPRGRAPAG